ncbi:MAG: enoyl-CoA hydratase/isomerase family protein [Candidatus Lambdaproteobacteria bacterium]|nr:enoyl-CoA hydratase/isomerase family protein [Candidatus Lambdaproteobacteria bacterium]
MGYESIALKAVNHVGWLEYRKAPVNAVDPPMVLEIIAGLKQLSADPDVRVIVLASALEKYFCVGADLKVFDGITPEGMGHWASACHEMVFLVRQAPKPVLAAIHGTAVGGGLELTLHCDLRFAATDARLGQPEIDINFIPPVGATQALVRLLGRPGAIRYLYDGKLVSAQDALRMGLVDALHPPESLRAEVQAYAETLAQKPPEALEAIRKSITEGMDLPFRDGLRIEKQWVVRLAGTRNFREGVTAFLAKRKPKWSWE